MLRNLDWQQISITTAFYVLAACIAGSIAFTTPTTPRQLWQMQTLAYLLVTVYILIRPSFSTKV